MALTDDNGYGDTETLHVDHFGLSLGSVSVGLAPSRTSDDVYRRYLDLMSLVQRGPVEFAEAPQGDLDALSAATGVDSVVVARRLRALQARRVGGS